MNKLGMKRQRWQWLLLTLLCIWLLAGCAKKEKHSPEKNAEPVNADSIQTEQAETGEKPLVDESMIGGDIAQAGQLGADTSVSEETGKTEGAIEPSGTGTKQDSMSQDSTEDLLNEDSPLTSETASHENEDNRDKQTEAAWKEPDKSTSDGKQQDKKEEILLETDTGTKTDTDTDADSGTKSDIAVQTPTSGSEEQNAIVWCEPVIEKLVRKKTNRKKGDIFPSDLMEITDLTIEMPEIVDYTLSLEDLRWFLNLRCLVVQSAGISDLEPISGLLSLTDLDLSGNRISDISPLAALTELKALYLEKNQIQDLTPLSSLINLEVLVLDGNMIEDVSALADLTRLNGLYLARNEITDITSLYQLTELEELDLSGNDILDQSVIRNFLKLEELILD